MKESRFLAKSARGFKMILTVSILGSSISLPIFIIGLCMIGLGLFWFGFLVIWLWRKRKKARQRQQEGV